MDPAACVSPRNSIAPLSYPGGNYLSVRYVGFMLRSSYFMFSNFSQTELIIGHTTLVLHYEHKYCRQKLSGFVDRCVYQMFMMISLTTF